MNIFENYLLKINKIITGNKDKLNLKNLQNIKKCNFRGAP